MQTPTLSSECGLRAIQLGKKENKVWPVETNHAKSGPRKANSETVLTSGALVSWLNNLVHSFI